MIIDCISDLHGHYPELEGGDLLIVAGDLTAHDLSYERLLFLEWLAEQDYKKKIWIAGNHDNSLLGMSFKKTREDAAEYLCDSGTEFEGLRIWGSPWTKTFPGMNPHCKAFTCETEEELAAKWALIPDDIDILVTHSPPQGIGDWVQIEDGIQCVGSASLQKRLEDGLPNLRLHCYGHIHEGYGIRKPPYRWNNQRIRLLNASYVNEHYKPVNKPIRIAL